MNYKNLFKNIFLFFLVLGLGLILCTNPTAAFSEKGISILFKFELLAIIPFSGNNI